MIAAFLEGSMAFEKWKISQIRYPQQREMLSGKLTIFITYVMTFHLPSNSNPNLEYSFAFF